MNENSEAIPTSDQLKEKGNLAVKNGKYEEAIIHYTTAIKLDPKNHVLYSNRSFAFLRMYQYTLALEDAYETIKLNPSWAKAYFRKAEIEFHTANYADAKDSYKMAYKLKPDDNNICDAIERSDRMMKREAKADEQIPWLGSGIGIVVGVVILIADYIFTTTPTHPMIMAFVTIFIAIAGYAVARLYRSYIKNQRVNLLKMIDEDVDEDDQSEPQANTKADPRNKYTKSQARQRFKKGKI